MPDLHIITSLLKSPLKMFSSKDPEWEVNLVAYGFGIVVVAEILLVWVWRGPRDGLLVAAISAFLTAVTTGLWKKGSDATSEPPKGDKP